MSRVDTTLGVVRTVLALRAGPLLLAVFAVVWPLPGFPWWPLLLVGALAVGLRLLGFGYLLAGRRGPALLVGLLVVTTLGAVSPWAAVSAVGAGLAVVGLFRLPRWQLLAVGMVLFLLAGAGWVAETVAAARRAAEIEEQKNAWSRAQLLPRSPREALNSVMILVARDEAGFACGLFVPAAQAQLAVAWDAPDCAGAVHAWHARITRPGDYRLSWHVLGVVDTVSPDAETGTVTGCGLVWSSPLDGLKPDAGPRSPGRMQVQRILRSGYQITDYRPC